MNHKNSAGSLYAGVLIILLGMLFLMDNFHLLDFGELLSDFWPVILIIIGANMVWKHSKTAEEERGGAD